MRWRWPWTRRWKLEQAEGMIRYLEGELLQAVRERDATIDAAQWMKPRCYYGNSTEYTVGVTVNIRDMIDEGRGPRNKAHAEEAGRMVTRMIMKKLEDPSGMRAALAHLQNPHF